jgi:hypothetical protein
MKNSKNPRFRKIWEAKESSKSRTQGAEAKKIWGVQADLSLPGREPSRREAVSKRKDL